MHKSASTDTCPTSCYGTFFNRKIKGRNKSYNSKKTRSLSKSSMGRFGGIFCTTGTRPNIFMISTFCIVITDLHRNVRLTREPWIAPVLWTLLTCTWISMKNNSMVKDTFLSRATICLLSFNLRKHLN
jgi:hypothetical protein